MNEIESLRNFVYFFISLSAKKELELYSRDCCEFLLGLNRGTKLGF